MPNWKAISDYVTSHPEAAAATGGALIGGTGGALIDENALRGALVGGAGGAALGYGGMKGYQALTDAAKPAISDAQRWSNAQQDIERSILLNQPIDKLTKVPYPPVEYLTAMQEGRPVGYMDAEGNTWEVPAPPGTWATNEEGMLTMKKPGEEAAAAAAAVAARRQQRAIAQKQQAAARKQPKKSSLHKIAAEDNHNWELVRQYLAATLA